MKINFNKIWTATTQTVRQFPVETGIILYAFVGAALHREHVITQHAANLWLIPLFFALAFILNQLLPVGKKRRWFYYLCWIPIVPLWFIDPEPWVESPVFIVSLVLGILGVLACRRKKDNTAFATDTVHYFFNAIVAVFFAGVAHLLLLAIYYSVLYIFNIFTGSENGFMFYSSMTYVIAAPLIFLTFTRSNLPQNIPANSILDILLNYIVTPALLVYTAVLYIYFIKIAVTWSLPKGGLAYMVFAFTILAMAIKACQPLVGRRLYDWYFKYFSLIALPAVAMFWIGSLHRVVEYGLTEIRIYLLLCGVIMTAMLAMFLIERTGRYLYVTVMSIMLFGLFSYIPPLSAKNLAIDAQSARVRSAALQLSLLDEKGEFIMAQRPLSDTVYRKEYHRMHESLTYLSRAGAPLFGLSEPDDLMKLLPEAIRAEIFNDRTDMTRYVYVDDDGSALDINGYTRMYRFRQKDGLHYRYEEKDDSLNLYKNDSLIWSISYPELLERQLEKIGYSVADTPVEDTIQAHSSEFLSLTTDSFRLVFSHIYMIAQDGNTLRVQSVEPAYILTREKE